MMGAATLTRLPIDRSGIRNFLKTGLVVLK